MNIRNIKNEKVRNIINELTDNIKDMTMSEFADFLQTIPKTYNYSFLNTMIIKLRGGTWVNGFKAWSKYNRKVSKGAKAIKILYPLMTTKKVVDDVTGEEKKQTYLYGFKYVNVFDVSDTEAIEGKTPIEFDITKVDIIEEVSLEDLISRVEKHNIKVIKRPINPNTGGTAATVEGYGTAITLNSIRSEADNKRSLVRLLAGYVLGNYEPNIKDIEQCEAEALTYLTLRLIGNDENALNYSIGYIKSLSDNIENSIDIIKLQSKYGKILDILGLKERYSSKNVLYQLF